MEVYRGKCVCGGIAIGRLQVYEKNGCQVRREHILDAEGEVERLKKARRAEAEANAAKKELVAKLSHDIKTPVASIKAAAEVGEALAENPKNRDTYAQIICKADQINTLVMNLFHAT